MLKFKNIRTILSGAIDDEVVPLPQYKGKYLITRNGTIVESKTLRNVPHYVKDGIKKVVLDGVRFNVSSLVCAAFKRMQLSIEQIGAIEVYHLDGDLGNIDPENLVVKRFPDTDLFTITIDGRLFKVIPGYTEFAISEDGRYVNLSDVDKVMGNVPLNPHLIPEGSRYVAFKISSDIGVTQSLARHRALALAFKDYPKDVDAMIVNHIDQVKGHDRLHNLEWATQRYNTEHAASNGFHSQVQAYEAKCVLTGKITQKPSLSQLARSLNINPNQLWSIEARKKAGYTHPISNPHHMFRPVSNDPWPDVSHIDLRDTRLVAYRVFDHETDQTFYFKSGVRLQKSLGLTDRTLIRYRDTGNLYNGYEIERFIPQYDWTYIWSDKAGVVFRSGKGSGKLKRPMQLKRIRDGKVLDYPSVKEISFEFSISPDTVRAAIQKGYIIRGGYVARYKDQSDKGWPSIELKKEDLPNIARVVKVDYSGNVLEKYDTLMVAHREVRDYVSYGMLLDSMRVDGESSMRFDNFYFKYILD